jgi:hypothetical protein
MAWAYLVIAGLFEIGWDLIPGPPVLRNDCCGSSLSLRLIQAGEVLSAGPTLQVSC